LRRFVWRWEIPVPPLLAQACFAAAALTPSEALRFRGPAVGAHLMLPSEMREFSIVVAFAIWLLAERNRRRLYAPSSLSEQETPQKLGLSHVA